MRTNLLGEECLPVFSRPLCAEVTDAIEKLSSCSFVPSTEIKEESGNSRMIEDNGDCKKLEDFPKQFNAFKETNSADSIRNLVTGISDSPKVRVDTAITVGSNIPSDMLRKGVAGYLFKSRL